MTNPKVITEKEIYFRFITKKIYFRL